MGNFLSSINVNDGKLSWNQVLMLGLVPLGQLYARVNIFNGSLDKWWLMFPLLLFPPLSFIPLIMMKFGLIKDGTGSKPIDNFMLIPIIAKLIIPFILPFIINENSSLCILPVQNNSSITKEQYLLAKDLVNKYEIANPPINHNNMMQKNTLLPMNNNM